MSRLMILAAAVSEISCEKKNRQTDKQTNTVTNAAENPIPQLPST